MNRAATRAQPRADLVIPDPIASLQSGPHRGARISRARRRLQFALAGLWLLDGLLQLQPYMFTRAFGADVLADAAAGNPGWIAASIRRAAGAAESDPVAVNAGFAVLQLLIALGIVRRRTTRLALAVSIVWGVGVWWFGEGLGGLLSGPAAALTGAPGAALLYALLAVLPWPSGGAGSGPFVAAGRIGPTAARVLWLILWEGLAALNLEPADLAPAALHHLIQNSGAGQSAWADPPISGFNSIIADNGPALTLLGAAVMAAIGAGVFLPPRWSRWALGGAVLTATVIWVFGEALGALFSGSATDPNTGPLLALLALAYWPVALGPGRPRRLPGGAGTCPLAGNPADRQTPAVGAPNVPQEHRFRCDTHDKDQRFT